MRERSIDDRRCPPRTSRGKSAAHGWQELLLSGFDRRRRRAVSAAPAVGDRLRIILRGRQNGRFVMSLSIARATNEIERYKEGTVTWQEPPRPEPSGKRSCLSSVNTPATRRSSRVANEVRC